MPKIIFTSRYLRDAPPAQLENYVRYIGTREGVEKADESRLQLPATMNQKHLIRQIIRDIPAAKEMLEYADFLLQPTMGNASEFISCALEQNLDLVGKRENYVDYIANRPRVERVGEHGLFTDAGKPVVLAKVQEEVTSHKGPVWTHVVSLRREDAARLGYDSAEQWVALLRSKRAMISKHMKINSENLCWYAAFHNESHHPHVHLMVYSAKDNDGYLTEKSIEAMCSELAHDIFRQDFAHIYEEQNLARGELKTGAANAMQELMEALRSGTLDSPEIEGMMLQLSGRLQNTGGKKVYGYLKRDVKNLIDQIVDELVKDSRIAALYEAWGKWNNEILLTYRKEAPTLPLLSRQPQFKSIKNMVIAEALKLGSHQFIFEDEQMPEPPDEDTSAEQTEVPLPEDMPAERIEPLPEDMLAEPVEPLLEDMLAEPIESLSEDRNAAMQSQMWREHSSRHAGRNSMWSNRYKKARRYLYGGNEVKQDFAEAFRLFRLEAESGNPLAMHDLGRMFAGGLGCEIDMAAAQEWYAKALAAFHAAEQTAKEKQRSYLQYRIGKMYAAGLGTEQNYETAAHWFLQAVSANHNVRNANKFALYSLAGLYYRGQGVEQDYAHAFCLYMSSAEQGNPYASYELAKMCRDGIGTEKDSQSAGEHFQNAFSGFLRLEKDSHDDKLQYRIGQMLHTGTGTEADNEAATAYWERSAKLGNVNAQYALGKLWLENGTGNPNQAVAWITKAADGGNAAAQYALAKLYRDGESVQRDMERAVELFALSAEQENEYAAYALGRLYLSGDDIPRDIEAAVRYLSLSAALGNPFAQYTLGKQYLTGEQIPKDMGKALELLIKSAEQKNQYAQYQLGKLYLTGEDVPKDVETAIRWLDASANQGNQFAQYALGKLYLCGHDVPRDKERAIPLLEAAAAQGNPYAVFLLEHLDSFRDPSAFLAATRLMHRLENLFREDYRKAAGGSPYHIDRKRRRKLQEKKQAQGHARDDREQQIHY